MDPRLLISISAGKLTSLALRLKKSGGTAAPGLFSLYIDKNALKKLSAPLNRTILVSGTNGKTTTSRLIGSFLETNGIPYLHNRHGSNLERGLVSALLEQASFTGEVNKNTALFEVDEAAIAVILPKLKPNVLVLTNLFRDQLDRYGEVDNIKRLWQKAFKDLTSETSLILNADDPNLAFLGQQTSAKVSYFGIIDQEAKLKETPSVLDIVNCPNCHSRLIYSAYYSSHQGDYHCESCEFKRPELNYVVNNIALGENQTSFTIKSPETEDLAVTTPLLGLFNIYNILSAFTALRSFQPNTDGFSKVVENFRTAFGRGEKFSLDGKEVLVTLAKNPTGFNEILGTFVKKPKQTILIMINDRIADGRDVSWLWDVDFEKLAAGQHTFITTGLRGADMNLRLKYAGINQIENITHLDQAVQKALLTVDPSETLLIIPTYTALLELKRYFSKKGIGQDFWKD